MSNLPLDLEDILIKKLDVRQKGEFLYGWQKLSKAFGIKKEDIDYIEIAYKRPGGSPTKDLLEILACRGKKISDLVKALKSPQVNFPDIALLIEKHESRLSC